MKDSGHGARRPAADLDGRAPDDRRNGHSIDLPVSAQALARPGPARPLRIAQVAPPMESVPPPAYGGTERVVHELVEELVRRGHEVTTFASADSTVAGRLVPTVPVAARPAGFDGDPAPHFLATIDRVLDLAAEFDVIHAHLEWWSPLLARVSPVPVVATFHGRLDFGWAAGLLGRMERGLVAISRNQASSQPSLPWTVVHNGLRLDAAPFEQRAGDGLCFVGRIDPEKGIVDAIELARRSGRRLRIAAKIGPLAVQQQYFETVVRPALRSAGSAVEFLGELGPGDRDRLMAESWATVMTGAWPEPFGLVAIESLACGTPVIARRVGALPEIVRDGVDGWFGDDLAQLAHRLELVGSLDRAAIRRSVLERFSAARMATGYEAVYEAVVDVPGRSDDRPSRRPPSDRAIPPVMARPGLPAAAAPEATNGHADGLARLTS